ncbi:hypothetical protein CEE45_13240 [Candidatus Heimdallarchaeota archaeon B3_Heim]|nr:MAG: hypothetical protein CEE45_13240 [Candidatus Heimdallarchaeota archaeon B3_Heim]
MTNRKIELENLTMWFLITRNFRLFIPFCLLPLLAIVWIINEVDPLFAIFSSFVISFLLYLLLNLKPFWKSLTLGISTILLIINSYLTIIILVGVLSVENSDIQYFLLLFIVFLLVLGDFLILISVFRQTRKTDFNDINKNQLIFGMLLVFGQIIYFIIFSLLTNELSWYFS